MGVEIEIRAFSPGEAAAVRELFIRVNRLLAPAGMREAFESYIARSLKQEIERICEYYSELRGGFWIAADGARILGMLGLEPSGEGAMELRRMYVDPDWRRQGIARAMLDFAEEECRRRNRPRMNLSTSDFRERRWRCIEMPDTSRCARKLPWSQPIRLWAAESGASTSPKHFKAL